MYCVTWCLLYKTRPRYQPVSEMVDTVYFSTYLLYCTNCLWKPELILMRHFWPVDTQTGIEEVLQLTVLLFSNVNLFLDSTETHNANKFGLMCDIKKNFNVNLKILKYKDIKLAISNVHSKLDWALISGNLYLFFLRQGLPHLNYMSKLRFPFALKVAKKWWSDTENHVHLWKVSQSFLIHDTVFGTITQTIK